MKMKKYTLHLIAIGIITLWALFSYFYFGVEDGSSGLSTSGWIGYSFLIPGALIISLIMGGVGSIVIPLVLSWVLYVLAVAGFIQLIRIVFKRKDYRNGIS